MFLGLGRLWRFRIGNLYSGLVSLELELKLNLLLVEGDCIAYPFWTAPFVFRSTMSPTL